MDKDEEFLDWICAEKGLEFKNRAELLTRWKNLQDSKLGFPIGSGESMQGWMPAVGRVLIANRTEFYVGVTLAKDEKGQRFLQFTEIGRKSDPPPAKEEAEKDESSDWDETWD